MIKEEKEIFWMGLVLFGVLMLIVLIVGLAKAYRF